MSNCLDNAILKNKLLLSLPKGCYFRLNEIVYRNDATEQIQEPIILPNIHLNKYIPDKYKPIDLTKLELKELHTISKNLDQLESTPVDYIQIGHQSLTLILYLVVCGFFIFIVLKYKQNLCKCFCRQDIEKVNTVEPSAVFQAAPSPSVRLIV